MTTHRVFDDDNTIAQVADADLDRAVAGSGPLATQIANAAAVAGRHGLVPRLRETLEGPNRRAKLAAGRALVALGDAEAEPLLAQRAAADSDPVVAKMFRVFALRLKGLPSFRQAFEDGDRDSELAGAVTSMYSGYFRGSPEDVAFLIDALGA